MRRRERHPVVGRAIRRQLAAADVLVLNKIDEHDYDTVSVILQQPVGRRSVGRCCSAVVRLMLAVT